MGLTPGDFAVVRTRGKGNINWFVRTAILTLTRSDYDHAFTYIGKNFAGEDMIAEATPSKGFKRSALSNYDGCEILWSSGALIQSPSQQLEAVADVNDLIGTPYNFFDIALLGFSLLTKLRTPKWIAKRLSDPKHMICSQAVDWITQAEGIHLFEGVLPGQVTPGMLANWIKAHTE